MQRRRIDLTKILLDNDRVLIKGLARRVKYIGKDERAN